MPKVSIITPIYNSETSLNTCIDSLVNQTLKDIELILIDDGSTDSSPQICDELAANDSRIKVVHNKNCGMGVSYNVGMDLAKSEYIGFLESDDFADKHMFEDLTELAEKFEKPDIVKSAWFNNWEKQKYCKKDYQMTDFNSYQRINIKEHSWLLQKQASVWSAIYKTEFIRKNNIRYLETPGASYQDVSFTFKAFCLSDNMVITPNAYVYYTKDNENSSVNSKEKSEVIFGEYEEVDKFFEKNLNIKYWANTDKLLKQFYDYTWNLNRINDNLKDNFIKRFANDFTRYLQEGELNSEFFSAINQDLFNFIITQK